MNLQEQIYASVRSKWKEIFNQLAQQSVVQPRVSPVEQYLLDEYKRVMKIGKSAKKFYTRISSDALTVEFKPVTPAQHSAEIVLSNGKSFSSVGAKKRDCLDELALQIQDYFQSLISSKSIPASLVDLVKYFESAKMKKKNTRQKLHLLVQKDKAKLFQQHTPVQIAEYIVTVTLKNGQSFTEYSGSDGRRRPVRRCKILIVQKIMRYFVQLESELLNKTLQFDKDLARFKVLAAFVVTNQQNQNPKVLSIGTGSKCVGDQTSLYNQSENAVFDSHAEIVARRAFKHLLYEELNGSSIESILEPVIIQGHQLKSSLKLHLFISYPPCGAAQKNSGDNDYDKLRTFKSGSEGEPAKIEKIRSKSEFYTCSDKIAMWNAVGVQGALLSAFIKPIYLDSIIIAHPNNPQMLLNNLDNAFFGRIDPLKGNKSNANLHKPKILTLNKEKSTLYLEFTGNPDERSDSSTLSHNWTPCELELLNSQTGFLHQSTNRNDESSRLSKQSFNQLFKQLIKLPRYSFKLPFVNDEFSISLASSSYRALKNKMKKYQKAKKVAIQTFEGNGLGFWIQRD